MTKSKIIDLYRNGNSIYRLAKSLKKSEHYIKKLLIDNGVEIRNYKESKTISPRVSELDTGAIYNDFLNGMPVNKLVKKYHTSHKFINKILKSNPDTRTLLDTRKFAHKYKNLEPVIISEYAEGMGIKRLARKYGYSEGVVKRYLQYNNIHIRNKSEAASVSSRPPMSESHKKKISEARKKYLSENPDKVPYLQNHSSRNSYPAKRFRRILEDINIGGWVEEYQFSRYSFDFAFPDIKLDVEVDGGTHKLPEVIAKDKERDAYSRSQGWTVLRIEAGMVNDNARCAVKLLMDTIKELSGEDILYDNERWDELKSQLHIRKTRGYEKVCPNCKSKFHARDNRKIYCGRSCAAKHISIRKRKVERPSPQKLISDVNEFGYAATGKLYGVRDNTIRKWLRAYDIDPKEVKKQ